MDPADAGCWAVHYAPPGQALLRRDFPPDLSPQARHGAVAIRMSEEWTFPPAEPALLARMGFTVPGPLWSAYVDIDTAYPGTVHRLLGHPDPIQGDMQQECQFASHGLRPGESGDPDAELLGGAWTGGFSCRSTPRTRWG